MSARALIVDDHKLFADAVRPSLEKLGLSVLAVTTGRDGVEAVRAEPFELVLVDIGLPDEDGLSVGRKILEIRPETTLLALTALGDPQAVREAMRSGFRGYVTKDVRVRRFIDAIQAALAGQVVIPKQLAPAVGGRVSEEDRHAELLAQQLTRREREVLEWLVQGASGREIAEHLSISVNTVRTHVQSTLTKLQVHSRLEAATFAVRHGLVSSPRNGAREVAPEPHVSSTG